MGLQRFPIGNFQGGWNIRDAPQELESNEAQDVLNVTLDALAGSMQQRDGFTRFSGGNGNTNGWPDNGGHTRRAQNMRPWYPDAATKFLMLSIDGEIWVCTTAGAVTLLFAGTVGTVWSFEQATDAANNQFLWAMNGVDAPKKISPTLVVSNWANNPPNGTMIRLWKNRMVVSGVAATPQRVFASNIGDPENPAATYGTQWVDIKGTEDDLDAVTELNLFGDRLFVFKAKSAWVITNSNPPWDNQRVAAIGCVARFCSTVCEAKLYFLNRTGIWSLDPDNNLTEETSAVAPLWTAKPALANLSLLSQARLYTTPKNRVLCALSFTTSPLVNLDPSVRHASFANRLVGVNSHILELIPHISFRKLGGRHYIVQPAVLLHDYPCNAFASFRIEDQDLVFAASSTSQTIIQLFNGPDDNGVAINAYWKTGWKSLIAEEPFERLRRINVEFSGSMVIDVFRDFKDTPDFSHQITSQVLGSDPYWAGGTWDGGTWDEVTDKGFDRVRPETRGRYHAIKFSNASLGQTFKIFAAEISLRGGKEH